MAKRNLVQDINGLGACLFMEYKVGDTTEMQSRRVLRGRRVILRVGTDEDRRRLDVSSTWGVKVVRLDAVTDHEVMVTVALVATRLDFERLSLDGKVREVTRLVKLRERGEQGDLAAIVEYRATDKSVDLGSAPKPRTNLDGPNVLPHVPKKMREAAAAQARMASAPPPARGNQIALPKKQSGGKKG